jgi:hypothetical protein
MFQPSSNDLLQKMPSQKIRSGGRRLSDTNSSRQKQNHWYQDVPHLYSLAKSPTSFPTPFRVLLIITSLSEYNKGIRGTLRGYDRLFAKCAPSSALLDSINSMTSQGWQVDVYLILGYTLLPERRQIIQNAVPHNMGLEIWDNATPIFYANSFNKRPKVDQSLINHGGSRIESPALIHYERQIGTL